jgi:hypothetical protein
MDLSGLSASRSQPARIFLVGSSDYLRWESRAKMVIKKRGEKAEVGQRNLKSGGGSFSILPLCTQNPMGSCAIFVLKLI